MPGEGDGPAGPLWPAPAPQDCRGLGSERAEKDDRCQGTCRAFRGCLAGDL